MAFDLISAFGQACPGVVLTRDIDVAIHALAGQPSAAQILAAVLPLIPEGSAPQYTKGAPPAMPLVMPGASPVYGAALPAQPTIALPIDGDSAHGTVATFAKGLKRFAGSNEDPLDGWSIDRDAASAPAGPAWW